MSKSRPTADQLRADIDAGRTGDKVAGSDPAAAPLGADAEAGGNPPSAQEVSHARAEETARTRAPRGDAPKPERSRAGFGGRTAGAIVAGLALLIFLIALIF